MKRMIALLLLLVLSAGAVAQDAPVDNVTGNQTAMDDAIQAVGNATKTVGDAIESTADALQTGVKSIGTGVGKAFSAIGRGVVASFTFLSGASAVAAIGVGGAALAVGDGIGSAFSFTGETLVGSISGAALGLGLAAGWIGSGLAAVANGYWDLVSQLRPQAMPAAAFVGTASAGGAATTGVGGWAGWNVLRKWGIVGGMAAPIAGFSRIDNADLLDHPVRSQIMSTIQHSPGIHASQLARDVGVGWGTISHHLDKLTKADMVTTRKVNNQRCFFEQGGSVSRQDMEAASAVKGDTAGRVAGYVHENPMTSQKQLSESLGISPALTSFHVKKLVNLGVLDRMRHGKETMLTTSSSMRRLLEADRSVMAAITAREDEALQYSA